MTTPLIRLQTAPGFAVRFTARRSAAGAPVDMTGWSFSYAIRASTDSAVLYTGSSATGDVVLNADTSTVTVLVPAAATTGLALGSYLLRMGATQPDGQPEYWFTGRLRLAEVVLF